MMRYLIRHQEPMTMASIGYIVVAIATLWYTGTWRLMLAGN
jgi:hypothetical protein